MHTCCVGTAGNSLCNSVYLPHQLLVQIRKVATTSISKNVTTVQAKNLPTKFILMIACADKAEHKLCNHCCTMSDNGILYPCINTTGIICFLRAWYSSWVCLHTNNLPTPLKYSHYLCICLRAYMDTIYFRQWGTLHSVVTFFG